MIRQDLKKGHGFCLLDPHGDLARAANDNLSKNAIYWDVADPACPYGYNPLTYVAEEYRPLVASGIIDALKNQWADAWGVRMEHLLRFALLALLSCPGSSLSDIVPMFTDKAFRRRVLQSVIDPAVLAFWQDEYSKMNYKNAFDGVAPIANKLGAFLSNPIVRKALCDPEEPLRFRRLMDEGTPLVVNLAKGQLGGDVSDVLGGLILSMITQAAYTRQALPESRRRPYIVYVDEFHAFTTESTAGMLSELRKYGVGLVLAAQYTSMLSKDILDAVLGNVGTLIVFRLGAQDAPLLARQLGEVHPADLIGLPNYRFFIRLMINGVQSRAFTARSFPRAAARPLREQVSSDGTKNSCDSPLDQ
ncbi:type IV secretory system conjugative DNA transfer family protein [uncultured Litoreibacter sp.]|uniref:type IV secretory system conjugative DNA transfer family protein n=1 Tax=uncultured Litoreibacter sp. TaxID=1392394 RepID=UPI00260AFAEC|nr:type IV secretory system conjugative DNA transfer family protein [uncultured Litoreibacter sp.]